MRLVRDRDHLETGREGDLCGAAQGCRTEASCSADDGADGCAFEYGGVEFEVMLRYAKSEVLRKYFD